MKYRFFDWDEANIEHISRHHVDYSEAEEVFAGGYQLYKTYQNRLMAYGKTEHGRWLTVVFERQGQGEIRVITARDMTKNEKRRFKK